MTVKPILFNDFQAEYKELKKEILTAIERVFSSGCYLLGPETVAFEQELASILGFKYVVAVANGTEAIAIALLAAGIKPGDEVIIPALTAYPTVIGIEMAGAVPVVCDVEADTGLLDPNLLHKRITRKTKVIMPVHLYGQVCNMSEISAVATAHDLQIIEDNAQVIFAKHQEEVAGSWSRICATSFYPSKNLGAYGDAGAVITNDSKFYEQAKRLRQCGQSSRYVHEEFGFNSRIDELQAAILRVKIPHVDSWIKRRRQIASYYHRHILVGKALSEYAGNFHTYHLFVRAFRNRPKFLAHCERHQLPTLIHYPRTVYQQPAFQKGRFQACPNAEMLVNQIVSLPIHPYLSDSQVEKICRIVNSYNE